MAEAIAAIAVVSSVISCIEFAGKLTVETIKFAKSSSSILPENRRLSELAQENDILVARLRSIQCSGTDQGSERAVQELAEKCQNECTEFLDFLNSMQATNTRQKITVVVKSKMKQPKRQAYVNRINELRDQLCIALLRLIQGDQRREFSSLRDCIEHHSDRSISTAHQAMEDIAAGIRKLHVDDVAVEQVLSSLDFPGMADRHYNITDAASNTFKWPFEDGPIATWLKEGSGLFWVRGKAGSGKSTLMKSIMADRRTLKFLEMWAKGKRLVVADHYFWMLGSPPQRSYQGMLQTLVHRVFAHDKSFVPIGCPGRCNPSSLLAKMPWSTNELFDCLSTLVKETDACYCFFIDGLDEYCPQEEHHKLISRLKELVSHTNVKVCVSSRDWTIFANAFGQSEQQIRLEDLTRDDMRDFVDTELRASEQEAGRHYFSDQSPKALDLIEEISFRAEGVFMWTYLVLSSMRERLLAGQDLAHLWSCLDEFPGELEKYLRELVYDRISPTWRQGRLSKTACALKLATLPSEYGFRPALGYWLALVCSDFDIRQTNFYKQLQVQFVDEQKSVKMFTETKGILQQACKDILRIYSDNTGKNGIEFQRVELSHRSMYDFLMTPEMQDLLNENTPRHFIEDEFPLRLNVASSKLHFESKHSCITVLDYPFYVSVVYPWNGVKNIEHLREFERSISDHAQFCGEYCAVHFPEKHEKSPWDWLNIAETLIRHGLYGAIARYPPKLDHTYSFIFAAFSIAWSFVRLRWFAFHMKVIPPLESVKFLLERYECCSLALGLFARQWALRRLSDQSDAATDRDGEALWKIAKLLLNNGAMLPETVCMTERAIFDCTLPYLCSKKSYGDVYYKGVTKTRAHRCILRSVEESLRECVPAAHLSELEKLLERAPRIECSSSPESSSPESSSPESSSSESE